MIERIDHPEDPRVRDYVQVKEGELVRSRGIFIAEGLLVVRTLVERSRFAVRSVFASAARLPAIEAILARLPRTVPVYIAPQEVMDRVVGFEIHRGVLAAGERGDPDAAPPLPARGPCRVVVLEALANHDNVGGIFRSAEALGAAAIFIDPRTADPLYRKAIRVSMGSTLTLPFARLSAWPDGLERLAADGFTLAALTPDPRAADIRTFAPRAPERIALLVGTEGAGLSDAARARCSVALRIPMSSAMDSLNAATATAIALFSLS